MFKVHLPQHAWLFTYALTVYVNAQHIEDEVYGLKQSAHALADPAAGAA